MKKLNLFAAIAMMSMVAMIACKEDPEVRLDEEEMVAPEISSPADGLAKVITADNLEENLTIEWSEAEYGVSLAVNYNVQVDVAGNNFAAGTSLGSTSQTSLTVTLAALNDFLLTNLEQAANTAISLDMKVVASAAGQVEQASEVISLTITTFEAEDVDPEPVDYPKLWVAGDFQGWNIGAAATIASKASNGIYEGYIYIPAGGTNEMKLYAQPDWGPTSFGTLEDSVITLANYAGANLRAPSDGYYLLSVNMNDSTFFLMDTEWGLIGDATPGGWTADTEMTFNAANRTWSVTTDLVTNGSFKFRANKAWQLDFGIDAEGKLIYANHPALAYVDRTAIQVPEDGNYTVTLNLSNSENYTYTIVKN